MLENVKHGEFLYTREKRYTKVIYCYYLNVLAFSDSRFRTEVQVREVWRNYSEWPTDRDAQPHGDQDIPDHCQACDRPTQLVCVCVCV